MTGPPPQPTAIRQVKGNPGHRPYNTAEPIVRVVAPECPEHLDEVAKREWYRLVPILLAMNVLTDGNYMTLASLCQTYSTMIAAQKKLSETGLLSKTPSGYIQQSPLVGIVNKCVGTINTLCREFGLTPAARTRVRMNEEPEPAVNQWKLLHNTAKKA